MTQKMTQAKKNTNDMLLPPGVTPDMLTKQAYETPDINQFADWTTTETGFAPYYEPFKGGWFAAVVLKGDTRDPNFERYLMQAEHDIVCRRGAKPVHEGDVDNRPVVVVKKGQTFTLGVFFGLKETLNALLMYQYEKKARVPVFIQFDGKLENATKAGRHPWQTTVRLHPEHASGIEQARAKLLGNESDGLPMLPMGSAAGVAKGVA